MVIVKGDNNLRSGSRERMDIIAFVSALSDGMDVNYNKSERALDVADANSFNISSILRVGPPSLAKKLYEIEGFRDWASFIPRRQIRVFKPISEEPKELIKKEAIEKLLKEEQTFNVEEVGRYYD
ncbi:conserved hypothetical protein [Ricinus communis]|uniref:Uncharacterized protein n=1 Tax=Ricinus communis TaxID=3988 RepID=B9RXA5_RICCO|nr:conserved hypothetical protein [Ricinus communis]